MNLSNKIQIEIKISVKELCIYLVQIMEDKQYFHVSFLNLEWKKLHSLEIVFWIKTVLIYGDESSEHKTQKFDFHLNTRKGESSVNLYFAL